MQSTLHTLHAPELPERLSPGQAAQLCELLEYLHVRIRDLLASVDQLTIKGDAGQRAVVAGHAVVASQSHERLSELLHAQLGRQPALAGKRTSFSAIPAGGISSTPRMIRWETQTAAQVQCGETMTTTDTLTFT